MKRIWYGFLSIIIALNIFYIPVYATGTEAMLPVEECTLNIFFQCNTTQGTAPFLIGEVSGITLETEESLIATEVAVSLDGENYTVLPYERAGDWVVSGKGFSRVIFTPNDPILVQYFNNEFDSIYISMTLSKCDGEGNLIGTDTKTVSDCWTRPVEGENDTPTGSRMFIHTYPNKVMSGALFWKKVQMQVTGTNESYTLPLKIPVILGFCPVDDSPVWLEEFYYPIVWKKLDGDSQQITYQAETIFKPSNESLKFYYKDSWYQVDGSEDAPFPVVKSEDFPFEKINCIVNLVEQGYVSPITLTSEQADGTGPVGIEIPYKPSEASKIEVQVSTDGGTTWKYAADVDFDEYPVDAIPKEPSYSADILTSEQMQIYSVEGNGGFQIRLKIYGGPLGNAIADGENTYTITESANWPSDYVYTPPEEPSGDQGSGGNKGDVGTDNSGSTEGVRPGTEEEPEKAPEPESTTAPQPIAEPEVTTESEIIPEELQNAILPEQSEVISEVAAPLETTAETETKPDTPSESDEITEEPETATTQSEEGQREKKPIYPTIIIVAALPVTGIFAVKYLIRRYRQ